MISDHQQSNRKHIMNHNGIFAKRQGKTQLWKNPVTIVSLLFNALFGTTLLLGGWPRPLRAIQLRSQNVSSMVMGSKQQWNGGNPFQERRGSCWCGADTYCMCTPSLAIDLIIKSGKDHIWLVQRRDTDQLATMGGFVDVGETVEHAVKRELMEEMGIELKEQPILFGIYSDPRRDNRRHTASVVYYVELPIDARPQAADDAKNVLRIPLSDIEKHEYFADHLTILTDYRRSIQQLPSETRTGASTEDIIRSTCSVNDYKI